MHFTGSLIYTRSPPKLCDHLNEDLCENVGGLCVWGGAGIPSSPITTSECSKDRCCTIYPEYLYNDLSNELFDQINQYDQSLTITNHFSADATSTPTPPQDDPSMCIPAVCCHDRGSNFAFDYGDVIYYVQAGDNQLFRCQPRCASVPHVSTCSPSAVTDSTGPQNSSYILKPLVYNKITNIIISYEDLQQNNSIYPINTFYNIYIDMFPQKSPTPLNPILYYFDNLTNRVNIPPTDGTTGAYNIQLGSGDNVRTPCSIHPLKFFPDYPKSIPIRLYSMNIYTKTIINECYQNSLQASPDSFCCSSNDPLCLQQYYTIFDIKEVQNSAEKNSEIIDVSELKNRPIRFFSDSDNNIIISTFEDSVELWWDWSVGQFKLPVLINSAGNCATIIKDDNSILYLNDLSNKLFDQNQNYRVQILVKSVVSDQDFECNISYVDNGLGPMINVLTVCNFNPITTPPNTSLGLLLGEPFCGNYLNIFALDESTRKFKLSQISLNDQMIILPIYNQMYKDGAGDSGVTKIQRLYKYIDKNTGQNMFTPLDISGLDAKIKIKYPSDIFNDIVIVPTKTITNPNIEKLISDNYEVVFILDQNKDKNAFDFWGPCYGAIIEKNSIEYYSNRQNKRKSEFSPIPYYLEKKLLDILTKYPDDTDVTNYYVFTSGDEMQSMEPEIQIWPEEFFNNLNCDPDKWPCTTSDALKILVPNDDIDTTIMDQNKAVAVLIDAIKYPQNLNPSSTPSKQILSEKSEVLGGPGFMRIDNDDFIKLPDVPPASRPTTMGPIKNFHNLKQKYYNLTNYIFLIKNIFQLICENLMSFRDQMIYNILEKVEPTDYDAPKCCGPKGFEDHCNKWSEEDDCNKECRKDSQGDCMKFCFWAKTEDGECPPCDTPLDKAENKSAPDVKRGRCWKNQSINPISPTEEAAVLIPPPQFFDIFINQLSIIINNQCQEMYNQFNSPDIINLIEKARGAGADPSESSSDLPDLVRSVKNLLKNFLGFILNNNNSISEYIKETYYTDVNNIIISIIKYWIPLYNPGTVFYQFYYTIEQFIDKLNEKPKPGMIETLGKQIFVIIPGIEEFIAECKFISSMMYKKNMPNNFWTEFTYQFGNYTKDQLKIRLEKNNIPIL